MSDINEPDDLLGMLPTEILAVLAAERAARLAAEQQIAALREGLEYAADLLHWDHRPLGVSRAVCDNQHCVRNRALLAPPAAESVSPCTCRDAASACGACLAGGGQERGAGHAAR